MNTCGQTLSTQLQIVRLVYLYQRKSILLSADKSTIVSFEPCHAMEYLNILWMIRPTERPL